MQVPQPVSFKNSMILFCCPILFFTHVLMCLGKTLLQVLSPPHYYPLGRRRLLIFPGSAFWKYRSPSSRKVRGELCISFSWSFFSFSDSKDFKIALCLGVFDLQIVLYFQIYVLSNSCHKHAVPFSNMHCHRLSQMFFHLKWSLNNLWNGSFHDTFG